MFQHKIRLVAMPLLLLLAVPALHAEDLSKYRVFHFGMDLAAAAKLARMQPSEAKMIHQRPALIQDLEWRDYGSNSVPDPVKQVVLSFCDDQLFRIVVYYDHFKTEGMTPKDFIDAISALYGDATTPDAEMAIPGSYSTIAKVIARWEDSMYSHSLAALPDPRDFALVLLSKRLDALAGTAVHEAIRLDSQEAPQREIELRKSREEQNRLEQDKARLVNKPNFRP
jgi:hypothetical protein